MGCQTSTEVKKFANDQPTDPPKQLNNADNKKESINNKNDLKKEEEVAATKIQALYRGFRTRLKLQENQKDSKADKKKSKQEEEQRADELLKVVLEDKAIASQEAKLNLRNNPEEEVFRSLRKIIQKSIDQDEPPEEASDFITDQVNNFTSSVKPKLADTKQQFTSKLTSGLESGLAFAGKAVEEAKLAGQNIKETIQEETKQELENVEQTFKETAKNAETQMNQLKEKFQEFDISKVASETVENVKEKVKDILPDKVKEMLPDSEKKDSDSRPESGKSENSESGTIGEKSEKSSDNSSEKKVLSKDENNNPENKKQQEEEVN